jgi:hypothetical protein
MNRQLRGFTGRWPRIILVWLALQTVLIAGSALAINITVDYRYDTNGFFDPVLFQHRRDALTAAADRFSGVITETLTAASLQNNSTDPRIGFTHPGTGMANYQVSPATDSGNDALVTAGGGSPANHYRGPWSIAANEWILYAGARPLSSAAEGGTGTGLNFTTVFNSGSSHLNRGFRSSGSVNNLPVWGGVVSFDNDSTNWHFDPATMPPAGSTDFYSIALHEIGHVLGLSSGWNEWTSKTSGVQFLGPNAVATYNGDNGTSLTGLNQVSVPNRHWQDGAYDSRIFQNANPHLVATVGTGNLQDLLMEPTANFTGAIRRFELTNVDVAALRDIGWSTVPQIEVQPGDYNGNGIVDAADYVVWRKGLADGNYATWRANFGESLSGAGSASFEAGAPEPASAALAAIVAMLLGTANAPRRKR